MTSFHTARLVAIALLGALFVAACGGSGLSAEERAAIDAIVASLDEDDDEDLDLDATPEENQCVGEKVLDTYGLDKTVELAESDGDFSTFTEEEIRAAYGIFDDCLDDFESRFADAIAQGLDEDDELPLDSDENACTAQFIVNDIGSEELFVLVGQTPEDDDPPQEFLQSFVDGLVDCADLIAIFQDELAGEIGAESAACLLEGSTEADLGELFLSQDDEAFEAYFGGRIAGCV